MSSTMSTNIDLQFRIWDALGAALVAGVVGLPMLGLTTHDGLNGLQVHTRWPLLGMFVVVAFVGRMTLQFLLERFDALRKLRPLARPGSGLGQSGVFTWLGIGCTAFALALPLIFTGNRYVVDTATTVLIYVMLGWGLNVVVGLAGLLDLGSRAAQL